MTHEYRLEEVDSAKSKEYAADKKAQQERQEHWLQQQQQSQKPVPPRVTAK